MDNATFINAFKDYSIDVFIVCYFYHLTALIWTLSKWNGRRRIFYAKDGWIII